MEVKIGEDINAELESSGENVFVGGESRWKYDTWTNWEVYPSEAFPVLMYFKETQTKPEGQIVSIGRACSNPRYCTLLHDDNYYLVDFGIDHLFIF